jgi:hypothetical protein
MTAQNDFTRRKWPRISLRMFLLVVSVFCVWMGVRTNRARHQRELVGRILELGGTIGYGCQLPLADMPRLVGSLTRLQKVSMANTNVIDSALDFLTRTTQLRELNLSNTEITNASIPLLTRLYRLEILNVAGTQITPDAIAELQRAMPDCKVVK